MHVYIVDNVSAVICVRYDVIRHVVDVDASLLVLVAVMCAAHALRSSRCGCRDSARGE